MGGEDVIALNYGFIDAVMVQGGGYEMTWQEKRKSRCHFTGHRPQKLNQTEGEIKRKLELAIESAIARGYGTFFTEMAYVMDIWAGEIVVRLRENNPDLQLIAATPFPDFSDRWVSERNKEYDRLCAEMWSPNGR